jgi:hypothetical protein
MGSAFVSGHPGVQTPEQKEISKLAVKENTAAQERHKSGPVTTWKPLQPKEQLITDKSPH